MLAASPLPAFAQDLLPGIYATGDLGFTLPQSDSIKGGGIDTGAHMDAGLAMDGGLGYRFENGIRLEGEVGYRHAQIGKIGGLSASGNDSALSGMGNVLYDIPINAGRLVPYVGAGAGVARLAYDNASPVAGTDKLNDGNVTFAYQGIFGLGIALSDRLQLTTDYRYFRTLPASLHTAAGTRVDADYQTHTITVGFRWTFYSTKTEAAAAQSAAAAAPAAAPAAPPAAAPRAFMVFFEFDSAELTPGAIKVIEQAAASIREARATIITVTGHTDRAGARQYNFRLSLRRANVVKAELIRIGIPADEIGVAGRGMDEPLVPTPIGVREPQNRRAEIRF